MSHAQGRHQQREDFASRLSRVDLARLLDRLDELADLDREMRRPGTLARPSSSPAAAGERGLAEASRLGRHHGNP